MKKATLVVTSVMLALLASHAQDQPTQGTDHTPQSAGTGSISHATDPTPPDGTASSATIIAPVSSQNPSEPLGASDKFRYYVGETYLNPSFVTAPAFRASIRMGNPPGHFPSAYPADWRQGAEGFGRNYADALAQRVTFQTARFATGTLIREDPRYSPSLSHNFFMRSLHAFAYTFVDQSDSGHRMPALSNFVGASAAGLAGNAYLPPGFTNPTHAGQRATLQFAFFGAGNLYREFAPQMPKPLRTFFQLIGR